MNRSGADAECFSRFEDSCPGRQLLTDAIDNFCAYRATPESLSLCFGAREASIDAASDHRSLELGECAGYLEQQATCRCRGIDILLIEVEIGPDRFQVLDRGEKVAQRAPNPIYRPCHHKIEPTPIGVLEHPIECRALVAPLRTADPKVLIDLYNRLSAPLPVGNTGDTGFVAIAARWEPIED